MEAGVKGWIRFLIISWYLGDRLLLQGESRAQVPDSFPLIGMKRRRPARLSFDGLGGPYSKNRDEPEVVTSVCSNLQPINGPLTGWGSIPDWVEITILSPCPPNRGKGTPL